MPTLADALASPFTLAGTVPDIVAKLRLLREEWGITRYTVRELAETAEVISALDPHTRR